MRHRALEQAVQVALEPGVDRVFAEVAERRVAHVVHQAGHLHQAFHGAFQPVQAELGGALAELLVQRLDDETAGLLNLEGMRQAAAHGGVAFQREDLGLLLQAADGGGVEDTPAVALELVDEVLHAAGGNPEVLPLAARIGPFPGNLVLEVHPLRHRYAPLLVERAA